MLQHVIQLLSTTFCRMALSVGPEIKGITSQTDFQTKTKLLYVLYHWQCLLQKYTSNISNIHPKYLPLASQTSRSGDPKFCNTSVGFF